MLASLSFDDEENFTEAAGIFRGRDVVGDGNPAGIDHLDEFSSIVMIEPSYEHNYSYDWRTKKPTIVRATGHWFATVEIIREAISQVEILSFFWNGNLWLHGPKA
ncbi:isoleucine--tRNA ligase, chloroplastic/mitochondrial-like protein [Tanacetum coccineum]